MFDFMHEVARRSRINYDDLSAACQLDPDLQRLLDDIDKTRRELAETDKGGNKSLMRVLDLKLQQQEGRAKRMIISVGNRIRRGRG